MAPRRDATQQATTAAVAAAGSDSGSGAVYSRLDKKSPRVHRSWARTLCVWGCILPLVTVVLLVALPLLYKSVTAPRQPDSEPQSQPQSLASHLPSPAARSSIALDRSLPPHRNCTLVRLQSLPAGQPFSIISNQTFVAQPSNLHSRFRGGDYIDQYDRFFFQWWNFLVYDAETHDHWTIVYHTTKYSKAANYSDYASTSMIHKQRSSSRETAHDAIPLSSLEHSRDWDLGFRKADGSVPHRITVLDDDTYNVVADMPGSKTASGRPARWNLTFHRVHGMYSGLDNEEGNKENCAVVSTLFAFHSRVSGWIEEGGKRVEFGNDDLSARRYRAYAAGSWGCKLPSGSPALQYPWTWLWLSIPGDAAATPPRPEIGMAMGTAVFQLNSTLLGDLYGGYANVGIGDEVVAASFGTLHHGAPIELPLTKSSNDGYLRRYELGYERWAEGSDEDGSFQVPLVQTYDVHTAHWRFQLRFESEIDQYFRCPVVLERDVAVGDDQAPDAAAAAAVAATRRLQVFSDYRAVGVRTHVRVWHRDHTPEEFAALRHQSAGSSAAPMSVPPPAGANATEWIEGAWSRVVFDGVVDTMNALEYAYESPMKEEAYRHYVRPQQFD